MNQSEHLTRETIATGILSIANICLLVLAALYGIIRSRNQTESRLRIKLGYLAVGLGMCSQILYCLLVAAWKYGWVPFDPGTNSVNHLEMRLSDIGGLLSAATVLVALFGRGLRRYAGIWVGSTTFCFWGLVGLGVGLKSLFR